MNIKLAVLRVDISKETGEVMIFMETACGFRPVIGWPNTDGLKDFAQMLIGVCDDIDSRKRMQEISDKLLSQVLEEEQ